MRLPITILTSIFPDRIDQQQKSVASWIALGFRIVSLNLPDESARMKPLFEQVVFREIDRPAANGLGSRIYLKEILRVIDDLPGQVFGIVNSDIKFSCDEGFAVFIAEQAEDAVVYGSRIDIDGQSGVTSSNSAGFDYFFFNKSVLPEFTDIPFALGMPYWDYWLPIAVAVKEFKIKRLISPVAFHFQHNESWTKAELDAYWPLLVQAKNALVSNNDRSDSPVWAVLLALTDNWRDFSLSLLHYLQYQAIIISYPVKLQPEYLVVHRNTYCQAGSELLHLKNELLILRKELQTVHRTKLWRFAERIRPLLRLMLKTNGRVS